MTKQLHFHFSAFPKKMTDYFKDILGTIILSPIFQNIIYLYLEIDEEKGIYRYQFSSAQSLSCVQLCATPWTVACLAPVLGDSPGNTGVGCHALLQIFPTQG